MRDISFSLNSFWFFCLFSFGSFGSFGLRACVDVFVHVLFLLFPIYISFIRGINNNRQMYTWCLVTCMQFK